MEGKRKISPAFEQFLAESRPGDKRDAIVVFSVPMSEEERMQERLRSVSKRLDFVKARAAAQGPIQDRLMREYKRTSSKLLSSKGAVSSKAAREELEIESVGGDTLPVTAAQVTRKTLPELAAHPSVVAIMPNQRVHLIKPKRVEYEEADTTESKNGLTWGLKHLRIPEVWSEIKSKGKGIKVAVLDTGVHGEHRTLKGKVKDFIVIDPLGRRIRARPSFDCDSHGTHVCGTIAGSKTHDRVSIGVAPEVSLYVAAVILGGATVRAVIEGIAWAIEKGVDIISMSLGFDYYEPLFSEVLDMLITQYGILPVVAIGNENHGNTSSPGNVYNAFSVGAAERLPGGKIDIPFFSSGASLVFPGAQRGARIDKPDVVAPGVHIYSCVPPEKTPDGTLHYSYMDGSSMATPHVAGVAALLMAAKPQASVLEIISALKDTAKHPNGTGGRPDNRWGFGMIRPLEALKALG